LLIGHASANQALREDPACPSRSPGRRGTYTRLPYFFSDQYDLGLEYVGYSDPTDAVVVRGSLADRQFIAFWHRDGIVTAAMHVNVWDVVEDLKAIVAAGRTLEPGRLADPAVALAELA
jgi:3-phenylpropionate/trans-cinnamate dioxygenase ferredoxin reductase component